MDLLKHLTMGKVVVERVTLSMVQHLPTLVDWCSDLLSIAVVVVALVTLACSVALWRNQCVAGLRVHSIRKLQEGQKMSGSDLKFKTAMDAETLVEQLFVQEGWKHVFSNKRVAVSRLGHNREIDIIAVGTKIFVVEVKHWRGWVWSSGSCWYQLPHPKSAALQFENVFSDNVEKAAALRRYLENQQRIVLPGSGPTAASRSGEKTEDEKGDAAAPAANSSSSLVSTTQTGTWYSDHSLHTQCGPAIVPVVVFTNPAVQLDPNTIMKLDGVFTLAGFRKHLRQLREAEKRSSSLFSSVLSRIFPVKTTSDAFLTPRIMSQVAGAVDVLRTWDVLQLHDGRVINGDVQKVIAPTAFCEYQRKHLLSVNIHWHTGAWGFVKTFLMNRSVTVELVLATEKRLAVKKREKKPRNAAGNIVFSIPPRRRKATASDHFLIRIPGNPHVQPVAIADVKNAIFSRHLYANENNIIAGSGS